MIKVLFICHGNICRSPMAECVFSDMVERLNLSDKFHIASMATSSEEVGSGIHYGTKDKLREKGIKELPHRAKQVSKADYDKYDFIIGMDNNNIRNMLRIFGGDSSKKIYLMKNFTDERTEVADPWYTHDFEATYQDILAGCKGFIEYLREEKLI